MCFNIRYEMSMYNVHFKGSLDVFIATSFKNNRQRDKRNATIIYEDTENYFRQ